MRTLVASPRLLLVSLHRLERQVQSLAEHLTREHCDMILRELALTGLRVDQIQATVLGVSEDRARRSAALDAAGLDAFKQSLADEFPVRVPRRHGPRRKESR